MSRIILGLRKLRGIGCHGRISMRPTRPRSKPAPEMRASLIDIQKRRRDTARQALTSMLKISIVVMFY